MVSTVNHELEGTRDMLVSTEGLVWGSRRCDCGGVGRGIVRSDRFAALHPMIKAHMD